MSEKVSTELRLHASSLGRARPVRGDLSVSDLAVCLTDGASSAVKNKVNLVRYII